MKSASCRSMSPGALRRNAARLASVCLGGCLLILSACATVAPYERERLAKPDMDLGRNADARAGEEHATAYREGSSGGLGSSGGGCGCN
jgi:Domain of unknown function (DUF4266)